MERSKTKKQTCRSIVEFKKTFFPKSFKKQLSDQAMDSRIIGINLANESLDKIKRQLAK